MTRFAENLFPVDFSAVRLCIKMPFFSFLWHVEELAGKDPECARTHCGSFKGQSL